MPPADSPTEFDLRTYLSVVRRRKAVIGLSVGRDGSAGGEVGAGVVVAGVEAGGDGGAGFVFGESGVEGGGEEEFGGFVGVEVAGGAELSEAERGTVEGGVARPGNTVAHVVEFAAQRPVCPPVEAFA